MSHHKRQIDETPIIDYLKSRVSRAQLLAGMGAGVAATLLPTMAAAEGAGTGAAPSQTFPFFPEAQGRYTTEAVTDILNVLVTASYLRATGVTANIVAGRNVPFPNEPAGSNLTLRSAQADAAIEQYHIDFWTSVGGTPSITTFTQAPANPTAFEARNDVHIAMYIRSSGVRGVGAADPG